MTIVLDYACWVSRINPCGSLDRGGVEIVVPTFSETSGRGLKTPVLGGAVLEIDHGSYVSKPECCAQRPPSRKSALPRMRRSVVHLALDRDVGCNCAPTVLHVVVVETINLKDC